MDIKSQAYLENLKLSLGVDSLDEISEAHTEQLLTWLENHKNPDVLEELTLQIPRFLDFANQIIDSFRVTVKTIVEAGVNDVKALEHVITQLTTLMNQPHLSDKDKREILRLITKYSEMLERTIAEHGILRRMALAGAFITTTILGGIVIYRLTDGKSIEQIAEKTGQKMIQDGVL